MIRVVAGRVLNRLICDLELLVDAGTLVATHNVHYDEIDHKVTELFYFKVLLVTNQNNISLFSTLIC